MRLSPGKMLVNFCAVWISTIFFACTALADPPVPLPPLPTADQLAWQEKDLAMLVRIGGADSNKLDLKQWMQVAKDVGFARIVLPARGLSDEFIKQFITACRENGVDAGVYLAVDDPTKYLDELTHLLTISGPINEIRFDGAGGEGAGALPVLSKTPGAKYKSLDWRNIFAAAKKLQPHAILVSNVGPDAR